MSITDRKKLRVSETDMGHILSQVNPKANPYNLDRKVTDAVADIRGSGPKTLTDLATAIAAVETDQALHAARNVTWIRKIGSATNETTLIHTVTTGKTLYIAAAMLAGYSDTGDRSDITLFVRDTDDAWKSYLASRFIIGSSYAAGGEISPSTPLPVPGGWDVCVYASAHGVARASFWGWEE